MIKEIPNPTLECIGCIFKDALQCLSMPCFADKDNPIKYIEVNEDINENNMEDKDIMSELKLEYRNNIVYFNGLKINAYTAEGMRLISNLLKKGLYEIGKELENVSNSK